MAVRVGQQGHTNGCEDDECAGTGASTVSGTCPIAIVKVAVCGLDGPNTRVPAVDDWQSVPAERGR